MEIEYSVGLEDLLAFSDYLNAHSPTLRRQHLLIRLVGPFPIAAITWMLGFVICRLSDKFWFDRPVFGEIASIVSGLLALLAGVAFFLLMPGKIRKQRHRLVEETFIEGQNRAFFARQRMTITPETITDATQISVTTMKWVAVEKIVVDQRHVYFYTGSASAFILPKAAFATEAEFNEFVETGQGYQRQAAG